VFFGQLAQRPVAAGPCLCMSIFHGRETFSRKYPALPIHKHPRPSEVSWQRGA
jgi:hypothetical protein